MHGFAREDGGPVIPKQLGRIVANEVRLARRGLDRDERDSRTSLPPDLDVVELLVHIHLGVCGASTQAKTTLSNVGGYLASEVVDVGREEKPVLVQEGGEAVVGRRALRTSSTCVCDVYGDICSVGPMPNTDSITILCYKPCVQVHRQLTSPESRRAAQPSKSPVHLLSRWKGGSAQWR